MLKFYIIESLRNWFSGPSKMFKKSPKNRNWSKSHKNGFFSRILVFYGHNSLKCVDFWVLSSKITSVLARTKLKFRPIT